MIRAGRQAGIPVGLCGEAAADPELLPLLLAWGLEELSVSPALLLETRAPHRRLDSRGGRGSGAPGDGSGWAGGDPGLL